MKCIYTYKIHQVQFVHPYTCGYGLILFTMVDLPRVTLLQENESPSLGGHQR